MLNIASSFPIVSGMTNPSQVYDTDGNILQAIDDHLVPDLLKQVLSILPISTPITITELGCGTGRNTVKLLSPSISPSPRILRINALDLSPGMLSIAQSRCAQALTNRPDGPEMKFYEFDALKSTRDPQVEEISGTADLVVSTLVLEHLPLSCFFATIKSLLQKPNSLGRLPSKEKYVLITNMHGDMGRKSQAGFVDEETGEKVRGDSYVYEVEKVLEEGRKWGFELQGEVREKGVLEADVGEGKLLGPRGRKWIGCNVWFGFVMKLDGRE